MKHDMTAGPRLWNGHRATVGDNTLSECDEDLVAEGWTLIDDPADWEQAKREHAAEQVDASDETRLAAWWRQEVARALNAGTMHDTPGPWLGDGSNATAPGVAGMWRLHASGVWMRWVLP